MLHITIVFGNPRQENLMTLTYQQNLTKNASMGLSSQQCLYLSLGKKIVVNISTFLDK